MKKITLILLSFVIYFNSITLANASTVGGWTLGGGVAQGASTVYNGTKNVVINGVDYIKKGTVAITPTAAQVAKTITRTVGVTIAIEALIGAIDWVLDPANNRVTYYEDPPAKEKLPMLWVWDARLYGKDGVASAKEACEKAVLTKAQAQAINYSQYYKYESVSYISEIEAQCKYKVYYVHNDEYIGQSYHTITKKVNAAYNPDATDERTPKHIPYDTVAQKLISNAASGDADAQAHTVAAAAAQVAEAETDTAKARPIAQQLEASSSTKPADEAAAAEANTATGTQTQNPTKPEATDLKLQFPAFCGWAPIVCEAAQKVISFPITLTNWWETGKEKAEGWATSISESWTEAKEWASSETKPEEKDTEVETIDEALPNIDTGIFQASGQCPPDFSYPFPLPMGGTYTVTYSYATACFWFSKLYYIVVSVAWVIAFRIVTNTNTGNSENG